jgi:hypothetical protein
MIHSSSDAPKRSFDPPQEAEWHRMIAEAAYYLAQKRGFLGEHSLDDWLAAEQQVRQVLSSSTPDANALKVGEKAREAVKPESSSKSRRGQSTLKQQEVSRFEKFASTQAAGDGIEGDVLKPGKTVDEKIGASMADRK